MPEPAVEPSIRGYLQVLRSGRWWVAAFSLLGLTIGLTLSLTATKQYSATAQLLVQSAGSIDLTTGGQSAITSAEVQTELQLVNSAQVQSQVLKKLGSIPGVSASQVGQTNVIAVTSVNPSPALAARIANVYAKAFVQWSTATTLASLASAENQLKDQIKAVSKQISHLESSTSARASALFNQQAVLKGQLAQLQVAGATAATGLELVTTATAPTSPSSPKPVQETLLGLIAGLIVGIGAAFLRDSLDDTLTTGEAVELVSAAPVLATVPMVPLLRKAPSPVLVSVSAPTSQPAEAYRSLRTSLQFARNDRPLRTLLVTSPSAGEGKTTVVVNLGAVFAQAGARVVLVSCDLRRPGLSRFLAPGEQAELCSVLAGEQPLDAGRHAGARRGRPVDARRARRYADNPTELLAGQRMRAMVAELSGTVRPRAHRQPAGAAGCRRPDLVELCRCRAARRGVGTDQARRAAAHRREAGPGERPVVGAVLNKATAQEEYGYYGDYQPYVLPASAAGNGRSKQNGAPLPSGQPGRLDR